MQCSRIRSWRYTTRQPLFAFLNTQTLAWLRDTAFIMLPDMVMLREQGGKRIQVLSRTQLSLYFFTYHRPLPFPLKKSVSVSIAKSFVQSSSKIGLDESIKLRGEKRTVFLWQWWLAGMNGVEIHEGFWQRTSELTEEDESVFLVKWAHYEIQMTVEKKKKTGKKIGFGWFFPRMLEHQINISGLFKENES